MFGKRRSPGSGSSGPGGEEPQLYSEGEPNPESHSGSRSERRAEPRAPAGAPPSRSRPSYEPATRRPLDALAARRQEGGRGSSDPSAGSGRKLVVGRGIRLSGEIKKCETLVVEGQIEADLNDCTSLEINEGGEFHGAAIVETARISGHFDGELTVKGRLLLRASGLVRGTIRYADLEIERGGRIAGDVDIIGRTTASESHDTRPVEQADGSEDDGPQEEDESDSLQAAASEKPGALI